MKVTYNWLKEFVDVKIAPEALAERLTMAGLSVAAFDRAGDDWVYDIEVTSNRPDWLSARGIAREVAAITGAKWKKGLKREEERAKREKTKTDASFSLSIEDESDCPLYYGALIIDVKVGPSPKEQACRLEALGIRPVNNVVDATNMCMLEFGQPLHAFDFDKLAKASIVVRRARSGEKLVLIDGTEKSLGGGILTIADAAGPVAVAGIMGGRDTEVTATTTRVLLESAVFDPVIVRRGARALGVATDASYRFERGVDAAATKAAGDRAAEMILGLTGGRRACLKVAGRQKAPQPKKILFSLEGARRSLGLPLPITPTKNILTNLGFGVRVKKGGFFEVAVPAFRRDVAIEEDVVEEVARSVGYDRLPLTAPRIKPFVYETPAIQRVTALARELLAASGCKEAVTYSLISDEDYKKSLVEGAEDALALANPLSVEARLLRTTLLPSLLKCAAFNMHQGNKDFEIFEVAHTFGRGREDASCGICLAGNRRQSWEGESRPYTLFDLKGLIESLFEKLQIPGAVFSPVQKDVFAPSTGSAFEVGGTPCGILGQLSDSAKRNWSIKAKADIFIAELCLDALAHKAHFVKKYAPIITTPSIHRDISLVAGPEATFAMIQRLIWKNASCHLKELHLAGSYQGKEIPEGSMGLTVSLEYGIAGKTLTDQEVDGVHRQVLDALVKELGVALR